MFNTTLRSKGACLYKKAVFCILIGLLIFFKPDAPKAKIKQHLTMPSFDTETFTVKLIAETLFYDEEYGALGNLSLIDESDLKECFIAAYSPEEDRFIIEEATEWEDYTPSDKDDIGYALAVDSKEYRTFRTAEETAGEMVSLARKRSLTPSITLLFEQDDIV